MRNKFLILMMLCAGWCVAGDSGGTKFRLNIGAGGAYILAMRYQNQFGNTEAYSFTSRGSMYPSLNIGYAFTPRLSLFYRYSHFLVFTDQPGNNIQQNSCFSLAADIVPSKKNSKPYLSFSIGYLQYWPKVEYLSDAFYPKYHGLAVTSAYGYRMNKHFRIQMDFDCLINRISTSIIRTYIDPNDNTNTIRVLGTETLSDTWYNILIGLSAFWDIF